MAHDRWRPRLVALDIDGTLLEPGGVVEESVRHAVRRAAESGAHVVLATGRCNEEAARVLAQLELPNAHAICSNGALTMRYPDRATICAITFDPDEVLRLLIARLPKARFAVDDPGFGYVVTGLFPDGELIGLQRVRPLRSLYGRRVTRVVVRDPERSLAEFMELIATLDIQGVSYCVGFNSWLDLMAKGVSKAVALASLATDLDVDPVDCLAIGDGRNDIEMLRWAGRGVAMAQAPAEVRASADHVTGSVAECGAATELDFWFASHSDATAYN